MYLKREELKEMGFASLGEDVQISDKTSIYKPGKISIGSRVRIDDFCVFSAGSGGIILGSNIHIAVGVTLRGREPIELGDFSALSDGTHIFSSSDDYVNGLTNPTVPEEYKHVHHEGVFLGRHVLLGVNCTVLPGVYVHDGSSFGVGSLLKGEYEGWGVYVGSPTRRIKERGMEEILEAERKYLKEIEELQRNGRERE